MNAGKDNLAILLGLIGILSTVYAVRLNLQESAGSFFYVLLVIQILILGYLIYVVFSLFKESWMEYRWSPDRLR